MHTISCERKEKKKEKKEGKKEHINLEICLDIGEGKFDT
jgi:hypothetical protein